MATGITDDQFTRELGENEAQAKEMESKGQPVAFWKLTAQLRAIERFHQRNGGGGMMFSKLFQGI